MSEGVEELARQANTTRGRHRHGAGDRVSPTLARDEVPVVVELRLLLPETWTTDVERMNRTGVPEAYRAFRTKPDIALAEVDRLNGGRLTFGTVLADAGYGMSAPFRQGLSARGLN